MLPLWYFGLADLESDSWTVRRALCVSPVAAFMARAEGPESEHRLAVERERWMDLAAVLAHGSAVLNELDDYMASSEFWNTSDLTRQRAAHEQAAADMALEAFVHARGLKPMTWDYTSLMRGWYEVRGLIPEGEYEGP